MIKYSVYFKSLVPRSVVLNYECAVELSQACKTMEGSTMNYIDLIRNVEEFANAAEVTHAI